MRLTPTQVESFYQDGYLVVEGALSDEDLNPLISDFEALITTLADELYAEGKISERYEKLPFERRIAWLTKRLATPFRGEFHFQPIFVTQSSTSCITTIC